LAKLQLKTVNDAGRWDRQALLTGLKVSA